MLFVPSACNALWDTWLYREGGTHYLFYLASTRPGQPWDAIGLATSDDGVHFDDHGAVLEKAKDAHYLGAGMTWKVGDCYLLNFSECRNGHLAIYFAESEDLVTWERVATDVSVSHLDPRWYAEGTTFSDQRWDNIWVMDSEDGEGYFGYVTAVSKAGPEGLRGTAAGVRSADGLRFETVEPVIEPGVWGDKLEIGAVAKLGDYYYMLVAQAEVPLGLRWTAHHPQAAGGVYVLRAEHQTGPFVLVPGQRPVLVSAPEHYTYFARFYDNAGETLVCHHSIAPVRDIVNVYEKPGTYLAPLKTAVVADGLFELGWWPGNEALFGKELGLGLAALAVRGLAAAPSVGGDEVSLVAAAGGIAALPLRYDLHQGLVVEFAVSVPCGTGTLFGAGLFIEGETMWSGTVLLADNTGTVSVGPYNGYAFRAEDTKASNAKDMSRSQKWRVLIRDSFVELYIDDLLVQCYTLPVYPGGRVGLVVESCEARFTDIGVREMRL